jgi:protein O-GlcNAc transferase
MLMVDEAIALLRKAIALEPKNITAHHNLLFDQYYLTQPSAAQILADAKQFGELVRSRAQPYTQWTNLPDPDRCLRIGMISGDLGHHPVGFFLLSILNALSSGASERMKVIAYPNRPCNDKISDKIRDNCAGWHSAMGLSDVALSELIRDDEIDILIDLSGHSGETRLSAFAWKPAPIQVTWLGYFGTTGVAEIDYIIADPWTMLPEEEQFFTEQVWRLPETRLCFSPPDIAVNVNPLPALSNGYVT